MSVKVLPKVSDFQVAVSSDTAITVPQNTISTYEITYGSNVYYNTPITIEASWSNGTIEGSPAPSVEIADYVIGSSTKAYGNISPVVDLINKKVTWTIPSFPARTTDRVVSFKLKTNDNYTGNNNVSFQISARLINPDIILPTQSVTTDYLFNPALVTPAPTAVPTAAPTVVPATPVPTSGSSSNNSPTTVPTAIPTPIPTSMPIAQKITDVIINSLSDSEAELTIATSDSSTIKINYGETMRMENTITSLTLSLLNQIDISKLEPDSTYYFQITTISKTGKTEKSDIFTLKTPPTSKAPEVDTQSLIITSDNNLLFSPLSSNQAIKRQDPAIVIPQEKIYDFRFRVKKTEKIKEVKGIVRNKYVLGASLGQETANSESVIMTEVEPGIFAARLKAPSQPGYYEIKIRVSDTQGNISEQKIADLKVSPPFTVQSEDGNPIEGVRVLLSLYNPRNGLFSVISPNILPIKNPVYSNYKGELDIALPKGKYQASIIAIGHEKKIIEFSIGANNESAFPLVQLKIKKLNLLTTIEYYYSTIYDFAGSGLFYATELTKSIRFAALIEGLIILVSLGICLLAISLKTHIPVESLIWFLFSRIITIFKKDYLKNHIIGKVINEETGDPEKRAMVYLIDADKSKILDKKLTTMIGEFYFKLRDCKRYKFLVVKNGFEEHPFFEFSLQSLENDELVRLPIKPIEKNKTSMLFGIEQLIDNFLGVIFSISLISSILFEILYAYSNGWAKAFLFITLSVLNFLIWLIFFKKSWKKKKVFA